MWQHKNVSEILQPEVDSQEFSGWMAHWNQIGDPLADAVIEDMQGRCKGDWLVQLEQRASEQGGIYKAFWDQVTTVPDWVDYDRMEPSRKMGLALAPLGGAVLLTGSLVDGYAYESAANLLASTKRLTEGVYRRVNETGQMVLDTFAPNGLKVGGIGHQTLIRVRIMHAVIRYHANKHKNMIDIPEDESPISQVAMAFTVAEFCWCVHKGMGKLNSAGGPVEEDSFHHLWRYAAYLLGVDDKLQTNSMTEQALYYDKVKKEAFSPNHNSELLAHSVIKGLAQQPPLYFPQAMLYELSRLLIGDDLADAFKLPRSKGWAVIFKLAKYPLGLVNLARQYVPGVSYGLEKLGFWYANRTLLKALGERSTFAIGVES